MDSLAAYLIPTILGVTVAVLTWNIKLLIELAGAFRAFKAVTEERHLNTTKSINGIRDRQQADAAGIHARLTEVRDEVKQGITSVQRRIDAAFRN